MTYLTDFFYENTNYFNDYFKENNENYFSKNFNYNITELSKNNFLLDLEVPGFDRNSIEIEQVNNKITIKNKFDKDKIQLLKEFNLDKNILVEAASIKNGILSIKLMKVVPEEDKPKLITIN